MPSRFPAPGGRLWTVIFIAVNVLLVAMAVVLGLLGYTDLVLLKKTRSGDDPIYVINQLGYEHLRLLLAAETGAAPAEIRLRGDIYLNRIDLLHKSPMLADERNRLEDGGLERLVQSADVTDRLISAATTPEGRQALLQQLHQDVRPVRDVMTAMSYVSRLLQTEERERRIHGLIINILILEALLAALIGLTLFVLRIISKLREMNQVANASADLLRKNLQLEIEKASADEASRAKSQFLSNMSHEIRTPLNGIIGTLQLVDTDSLTRDNKDSFDIIRRSSRILLQIVNSILDIAKIESNEAAIMKRQFDIRRLASDVLAQHEVLASDKSIDLLVRFDDAVPAILYGDSTKLEQILNNLLSNALKFTEDGAVTLTVEALREPGLPNGIRLGVTDTGIGISEKDQALLFEPFRQVDGSLTRRYMGTGLGLSIVRRLASLMQGSATLTSTPGVGTTVTVCIPDVWPQGLPLLAQPASAPGAQGEPAFLLLGGEYSTIFRAGQMLSALGKPVRLLYTPEDAADFVRSRAFPVQAAIVDRRFGGDARALLEALSDGGEVRWDIPTVFIQGLRAGGEERAGYVVDEVVGIFSRSSLMEALQRAIPRGRNSAVEDGAKPDAGPVGAPGLAHLKVLVVDDNAINRRVLVKLLANMEIHASETAASAAEALHLLSASRFDLVLMDIQMPEIDGYMATRLIRDRGHADVRIVACSAHAFETDAKRSLAEGMDGHISKPVVSAELERTVRSLFTKL